MAGWWSLDKMLTSTLNSLSPCHAQILDQSPLCLACMSNCMQQAQSLENDQVDHELQTSASHTAAEVDEDSCEIASSHLEAMAVQALCCNQQTISQATPVHAAKATVSNDIALCPVICSLL